MKNIVLLLLAVIGCAGADPEMSGQASSEQETLPVVGHMEYDPRNPDMARFKELAHHPDVPAVNDGDIGRLEQPIGLYTGYGTEASSSSPRCILPYGGGECQVPNSKTIRFGTFIASNECTSNWNAVFQAALSEAQTIAGGRMNFINVNVQGGNADFMIYCLDDSGNNPPGRTFVDTFFGYECHEVNSSNDLCQYENGFIDINLTSLINKSATYFSHSWAQQQRFVKNVILHEIFHVAGLGHSTTSCGELLMGACSNQSENWYNIQKRPTSSELLEIECYNPGSGGLGC